MLGLFLSKMEEKDDATSFEDFMSVLEPDIHSLCYHLLRSFWKVVMIVNQLWYEYFPCVSTPFNLSVASTKKPQLRSTSILQAAVNTTLAYN